MENSEFKYTPDQCRELAEEYGGALILLFRLPDKGVDHWRVLAPTDEGIEEAIDRLFVMWTAADRFQRDVFDAWVLKNKAKITNCSNDDLRAEAFDIYDVQGCDPLRESSAILLLTPDGYFGFGKVVDLLSMSACAVGLARRRIDIIRLTHDWHLPYPKDTDK